MGVEERHLPLQKLAGPHMAALEKGEVAPACGIDAAVPRRARAPRFLVVDNEDLASANV
jgi:hypothetical protein